MNRCEECGAAAKPRHASDPSHLIRVALNRAARDGFGPVPPPARALAREFGMAPRRLPYVCVDGALSDRTWWSRIVVLRRDELESLAQQAGEDYGAEALPACALRAVVAALDRAGAGEPFVRAWTRVGVAAGWSRNWALVGGKRALA